MKNQAVPYDFQVFKWRTDMYNRADMTRYKIIALDLDGTLITNDGVILERVKQAIGKAVEQGIYVVLSTGRIKKGVQKYYDELALQTLMISSGGAEVHDAGGNLVYSRPLDPGLTKALLSWADELGVHAQAFVKDTFIYRVENRFTDMYEEQNGFAGVVVPDILDKNVSTPKVLFALDEDRIDRIRRLAEKRFPQLSIKRSYRMYLDFYHPDASKGKALAFVADYYHVPPEQIIAIGDTEIDLSMLEYAGLGAAMGNADKQVMEAADIVCPSNCEGGIADIIQKYILEA